MIEPTNIPLFKVRNISPELEEKIKNDNKIRRENKIKMTKENEDKAKEDLEEENERKMEQLRLEYQDNNDSEDRISDIK